MPQFASVTETAAPAAHSAVLVGDGHLTVDRPLAASTTYRKHELLFRDPATGRWRAGTAEHRSAPVWVADTATAVGAIRIPATRPVTLSADAGNTGDGTVTAAATAAARAGLYRAVCVAEASGAGTFRLIDPTGQDLGAVAVSATGTTLAGVTLTVADGTNDWDKGDRIEILVAPLRYYTASAVAGDTKTHATTEPTWPTSGTVTDDQVTWTYTGEVDDPRDHAQIGVLLHGEGVTVTSGVYPTMPVVQAGQVRMSEISGLPASTYTAGHKLGDLILEA